MSDKQNEVPKGDFAPYIGKRIKYLAPQTRTVKAIVQGKEVEVPEFRQAELTGRVTLEVPKRREVQIDEQFHRYEDVTILEVEGEAFEKYLARTRAAAEKKPPVVRWNPKTKTVINHETGSIDIDATNETRAKLGLPVPWTPEIGAKEFHQPAILLPTATEPAQVTD